MSMMSRRGLEEEPAPVRTKPSQSQQEKLLELFAAKPWLCAGPPRSGYARDRNRAAWQDIAAELNADLSGCHKTWKRWAKFWSDKRSSIKKKVRQRTIERLHATADAELDSELTGIEEQMLVLMGGEAAVLGDRDPTLNPYIPHVSVEYGSNEDHNTPSQSLDQCSSPAAPASPPARPASPAPPLVSRARRCLRALARRHPALRGDPAFRDLLALLPAPESERRSLAAGDSDELDDERADSDEPGEAAGSEPVAARVKAERADSVERDCGCDQVSAECAGCRLRAGGPARVGGGRGEHATHEAHATREAHATHDTHHAHATHGTHGHHNMSGVDHEEELSLEESLSSGAEGAGGGGGGRPPRAKRRRALPPDPAPPVPPAPLEPPEHAAPTTSEHKHHASECTAGGAGDAGDAGALSVFAQYVAALLRPLPPPRRRRLQRVIVARLLREQAAAG